MSDKYLDRAENIVNVYQNSHNRSEFGLKCLRDKLVVSQAHAWVIWECIDLARGHEILNRPDMPY